MDIAKRVAQAREVFVDEDWPEMADLCNRVTAEIEGQAATIACLTAEKEQIRNAYGKALLLAWGGVCPADWAINGDPQEMAEQIRRRGDELQAENARLQARVSELEQQTHYWSEVNEEWAMRCVGDFADELVHAGGSPGDAFEVTPLHAFPPAYYALVPHAGCRATDWDGDSDCYDGEFDTVGPFGSRVEAEAAGRRVTAERREAAVEGSL